ncbi:hypothetical protein PC116_g30218 [Phytophthora cactorum]|nr:hypothetical protein PC116_g30218 [Phytophthora cactorum]
MGLANAYETYKIADSNEVGEGIYTYKESLISSVIDIITTVVAAVLPLSSIVVLYLVKAESTRLGILIIFSACFALVLTLMTSARRIEVFAATAAYVLPDSEFDLHHFANMSDLDMPR